MGRVHHAVAELDCADLGHGLWQGSRPTEGSVVANAGFHTLVLCAREYQPPRQAFPGVEVLRLRLDDDLTPLDNRTVGAVFDVSTRVTELLRKRRKVLVTCAAGLNRSGLVSASALRMLLDASADDVIRHIRAERHPAALSNPLFESLVRRLHKRKQPRSPWGAVEDLRMGY
jgi:protein-tyrosine phosphatase